MLSRQTGLITIEQLCTDTQWAMGTELPRRDMLYVLDSPIFVGAFAAC